jgi:hypothetical protein
MSDKITGNISLLAADIWGPVADMRNPGIMEQLRQDTDEG